MTSVAVNCPLCFQPTFPTLTSLSVSLVNVATRLLKCPVCHDTLNGLDKFTIHLFGHTLDQQILLESSVCSQRDDRQQCPVLPLSVPNENAVPEVPAAVKESHKSINNKTNSISSHNVSSRLAHMDYDKSKELNLNASGKTEAFSRNDTMLSEHHMKLTTNKEPCKNVDEVPESTGNTMKMTPPFDSTARTPFLGCNFILINEQQLKENNNDLIKNLEPFLKCNSNKTVERNVISVPHALDSQNLNFSLSETSNAVDNNNMNKLCADTVCKNNNILPQDENKNRTKMYGKTHDGRVFETNSTTISTGTTTDGSNVTCYINGVAVNLNLPHDNKYNLGTAKSSDGSEYGTNDSVLKTDDANKLNVVDNVLKTNGVRRKRNNNAAGNDRVRKGMMTQGIQTVEESFTKSNINLVKFTVSTQINSNEVSNTVSALPNAASVLTDTELNPGESDRIRETEERNLLETNNLYHCDICLFSFPDESILKMHRNLVHYDSGVSRSDDGAKRKSYACHLCSKSFNMRGSLMVHRRVAHPLSTGGTVSLRNIEITKDLGCASPVEESIQFTCSTCGKSFKKETHLSQHEKTHEVKQWDCDICSKVFSTKYFLKKHKRLHTGEMPYNCATCGKSFTFQQSYHKHQLYHGDDKPHVCGDCGRAFKELSTLHNHQRIHTGEKPFSCETCVY